MRSRVVLPTLLVVLAGGCGMPRLAPGTLFPELPPPPPSTATIAPTQPAAVAGRIATFKYETPTAPMKQCVYTLDGNPYFRTIPSGQACPLTIIVTP